MVFINYRWKKHFCFSESSRYDTRKEGQVRLSDQNRVLVWPLKKVQVIFITVVLCISKILVSKSKIKNFVLISVFWNHGIIKHFFLIRTAEPRVYYFFLPSELLYHIVLNCYNYCLSFWLKVLLCYLVILSSSSTIIILIWLYVYFFSTCLWVNISKYLIVIS